MKLSVSRVAATDTELWRDGRGREGGGGKAGRKGRERAEGRHDARRSPNSVRNVERQHLREQIAVMAKDLHQA